MNKYSSNYLKKKFPPKIQHIHTNTQLLKKITDKQASYD